MSMHFALIIVLVLRIVPGVFLFDFEKYKAAYPKLSNSYFLFPAQTSIFNSSTCIHNTTYDSQPMLLNC